MEKMYSLNFIDWNNILHSLLKEFDVYAPYSYDNQMEYTLVSEESVNDITYNHPKPSSPLKTFFLPVKENVVRPCKTDKKRIIIGAPACDLSALSILDEIYLDKDYIDPNYSRHRENTILIGCDCHSVNTHCHCTAYGFQPYPTENTDIVLSKHGEAVYLEILTEKGKTFFQEHTTKDFKTVKKENTPVPEIRKKTEDELHRKNEELPDYRETGQLITESGEEIWKRYSDTCVSCGACSAICPTCSCFLFIERPEFEKVRSLDTCQYPGFERVAAGEDPLRPLPKRFRNRYMCKYVWKPEKFESKACTGCGRCIEACIGEINKNELFTELNKKQVTEA